MRFFWQDWRDLKARVYHLDQQVFLLTVQVKELKNDGEYLMGQVQGLQDREKMLQSVERTVERAASKTTIAILKVDEQITRFRLAVEELQKEDNEGSDT